MADASDSKSDAGDSVWVQVPSPAQNLVNLNGLQGFLFLINQKYLKTTRKTLFTFHKVFTVQKGGTEYEKF